MEDVLTRSWRKNVPLNSQHTHPHPRRTAPLSGITARTIFISIVHDYTAHCRLYPGGDGNLDNLCRA